MMFVFAILLGIYSYIIFFLGIVGWLYGWMVIWLTVAVAALLSYKVIRLSSYKVIKLMVHKVKLDNFRPYNLITLLGVLLALQGGVNLIGVLGPELGFDALWYHLTLPKLYLINHSIDFIPGGLLYYSAMPKLGEMLYTAGLVFGNENFVKFIHYSFGLFTCLAIYKLSRKFFTPLISLIAVVIFYSNLVVGWESTSGYIDLVRSFFEVMALWAFVEWVDSESFRNRFGSSNILLPAKRWGYRWLVLSAIMVGLAITTKLLAIGSLVIFIILIWGIRGIRGIRWIRDIGLYGLVALVVPLPWFIFSYLHTGNAVYPFFTEMYKVAPEPVSLVGFVREVWVLFTQASDPVSPVYVMMMPIAAAMSYKVIKLSGYKVFRKNIFLNLKSYILHPLGMIFIYSFLAVVIWYFTPRTGGGRFILPYLPALSILCAAGIDWLLKQKEYAYLARIFITIVVFVSFFSIAYRFAANSKYIPVIIGTETKGEFLTRQLHFDFGDFYDIDGYFSKNIKPTDTVLLYGFHNLYYVDFPFIDSSWAGEMGGIGNMREITHIAVQKGKLPKEYNDKEWKLVYENEKTMVKLYRR